MADRAPGGDELARTATAPGSSPSGAPAPAFAPGDSLGRYRLESEIGDGGMGVVYAAFDADLERRIALKVLRGVGGDEARQRLLREARAMARLAHPNVVTVHEVGSAGGRDYVAMELVEGETLADWLRAKPHTIGAILDAFVAAGRGIAAAHAAGLVHRDFKPHNVLRSRDGRILVTDFGLARGVDVHDPLAITAVATPSTASPAITSRTTPTSMAGITITGSVLGTPAYMAPEQWRGGTVGPATDQFAFCVAVWEALTGARPYCGVTVDELRREVERGPALLDASKMPRWVRAPLRRGLDADPRRRWPSMDALLSRIDPRSRRADKRAMIALGAAGGAVVAVAIAIVAGHGAPAAPACTTKLDPAVIWPDGARAAITAAGQRPAADVLDADAQKWIATRGEACAADPEVRTARLGCLDAVLARFDAVARGVEQLHGAPLHVDAGEMLVDPAVCVRARSPRLTAASTPQLREVVAFALREEATPGPPPRDEIAELVRRTVDDSCANAIAHELAVSAAEDAKDRNRHLDQAQQAAGRCGDDRLIADLALVLANTSLNHEWLGDEIVNKVKLAESAVEAVTQPDLAADLEQLRMNVASRAQNLDTAIQRGESAAAGFAARGRTASQIGTAIYVLGARKARGLPDDVANYMAGLDALRVLAVDKLGADDEVVRQIDGARASWLASSGDLAGSHAAFAKLRAVRKNDKARHVAGRVVDPSGAPVAGASVVVGASLSGDALAVAIPGDYDRTATTDADGRFSVDDAPKDGVAVAQLGDRRAWAVPIGEDVRLVLEPTSRVEGTVDLHGAAATNALVVVLDPQTVTSAPYEVFAPVSPDGHFVVDGVPRRTMHVATSIAKGQYTGRRSTSSTSVQVDGPVVTGVQLAVQTTTRVVNVIVRSTVGSPLANAQAFVTPGVMPPKQSAADLVRVLQSNSSSLGQPVTTEHTPQAVVERSRSGDLYVTIDTAPEGTASACAVALPGELADDDMWIKVRANYDKIEFRCAAIGPTDDTVVIEVPPWPRFD